VPAFDHQVRRRDDSTIRRSDDRRIVTWPKQDFGASLEARRDAADQRELALTGHRDDARPLRSDTV
jgi:hypothetical protein